MKPSVFIASSVESLDVAYTIQQNLDHDADVTVWSQGVFEPSSNTLDDLISAVERFDLGIFVFAPDDVVKMRTGEFSVTRDNVLFELGLFMGRVGKKRTFIVTPGDKTDLQLPSDLKSYAPLTYKANRDDNNLNAALGPASHEIRKLIRKLGTLVTAPVELLVPENPREVVLRGAGLVRDIVGRAYGPNGTFTSFSIKHGEPVTPRHGFLIAENVRSENELESVGIRQMAQVSRDVFNRTGDATKLAIILAYHMAENGHQILQHGHIPKDVLLGMEKAVQSVVDLLMEKSVPTRELARIIDIGRTAARDDRIAKLVGDVIDRIGQDGVVYAEESNGPETIVEIREGMQFNRGYLSPRFITDLERNECVLEDCLIFIHESKLSSLRDMLPLLEKVVRVNKPLLIIAEDVEGELLETLVVNKLKGSLSCVAVKSPGTIDHRKGILEDIALLTGAKAITRDLGMRVEHIELVDLGRAKKVVVDVEQTTIIEGHGLTTSIESRVKSIRAEIDKTSNQYYKTGLEMRLANLVGGVATIRTGGLSQPAVEEENYKVQSAMNSMASSIRGGWVLGGGKLFHIAKEHGLRLDEGSEAEKLGRQAVLEALDQPIRQIIGNAKKDVDAVLSAIDQSGQNSSFNADKLIIEDFDVSGIIDPTLSLIRAIELAFSRVRDILQTDAWSIAEAPVETDAADPLLPDSERQWWGR